MGRKEYRTYHLRKCTLHYLETRRYLNISESETSKKKKECHCAKETKYWVKAYCIHYFLFFFFGLKCFLISIVISFLSTGLFKSVFLNF